MKISIVIPAYNEADNICVTLDEIVKSLALTKYSESAWEIIVVDDHSSDDTYELVRKQTVTRPNVRSIRLSRQSGSHVALRAGLKSVEGDVTVCLSADGQDDPNIFQELFTQWEAGKDIVWALRRVRQDEPFFQKLLAHFFYKLLFLFEEAPADIDLDRADFYLLDRKVVNAINQCHERNSSLFGLIAWLGFNQGYVEYDRRGRRSGESKWNFRSRMRLAKDWIIAFSGLPLKLMTVAGFFVSSAGFLYALLIICRSILYGSPIVGWPSMMTVVLVLGGGQMLMLGVIGEYLWRTLDESRSRPTYFIELDTQRKS